MKNSKNTYQKFSFYKAPVTNIYPAKSIGLLDVYKAVSGQYFTKPTQQLRCIFDKNKNRKYKATHFPYVTFSGIFSKRNEASLIQHSGLIALDFDHLENVEKTKLQLLKDPYFETQLLFISPNGNGLKWIIEIEVSEKYPHGEMFQRIYYYIKQTYSIEADRACKDVSRATFLCYDPEAFIHPKYEMRPEFNPEIWLVERKKFNPAQWLHRPQPKKQFTATAPIHSAGKVQHDVEVVVRRIEASRIDLTMNYEDWIKLGFAFASEFGEAGRGYFHRVSRFWSGYDIEDCNRQFDKCARTQKTGTTIRTFFAAARDAGINVRV